MADQSLEEELEVLSSIYAECITCSCKPPNVHIAMLHMVNETQYTIDISFSSIYPHDHSDIVLLIKSGNYYIDSEFANASKSRISNENPMGNILFELIEEIKEQLSGISVSSAREPSPTNDYIENLVKEGDEHIEECCFEFTSRSRNPRIANGRSDRISGPSIIHGPCILEQKSTFQAHIAPVSSLEDVDFVRNELLSDKKVAAATHNIMAYRFVDPVTGVVYHDCDDDGECAAGGRLAEMVRLMGSNNVIVVVSRWFGGVKLGPSRFKFICNTARDLLEEHGFCHESKKSKRSFEK